MNDQSRHRVALCGSCPSGNLDHLVKGLVGQDILQMSLIGREVTLQVNGDNLDKVITSLRELGVDNINILEWRRTGVTLANSGAGTDPADIVTVSIIPSVLDEGVKSLAVLHEVPVKDDTMELIADSIEAILESAGVTDAIYTVHIKKKAKIDHYISASESASLNALFDSGGIVNLE